MYIVIDNTKGFAITAVETGGLRSPLNLYGFVIRVFEGAEYNKEKFPGVVYRLSVPKVVMPLFGSGKLVVTGGKKPEDTEAAGEKIVIELDGLGLL